ncbi:MAG: thioredoxin domain-containing protein [Leptospiraceae bacterium]|nr:thioredoxin domain-containing protein [Leptospiraceae bacterium]MCZ8347956.1 thioredoxin domain-containing protein [Leptospiraceae bacterium]
MDLKNSNKLVLGGLGAAVIGVFLSFLLVLEYFGSAGALGQGLCSVVGSGDSCHQVASSSYSAIRNLPFFGDIPIALFGLGFYGSMAFGYFRLNQAKDEAEAKSTVDLLFIFACLALAIDLVLLIISVGVIGTICSMCVMTYLVSIALLGIAYLLKKKMSTVEKIDIVTNLKKNILNYAIAFLAFFSLGQAIGKSTSNQMNLGSENGSGSFQAKITAFEAKPSLNLDLKGSAIAGNPDAPIVIVKYADFNCGHCMHTSHVLNDMIREFDGLVKVVYMNFPLDGNCNRLVQGQRPGASSCIAATAALCGDRQGKFKTIYDGLYKDTENGVMHSPSTVLNLASKSSLNMNEFKACMGSGVTTAQLNKEIDQAEKLNIQSTPSLFINNKALDPGSPDEDYLRALLKYLVNKA